MEQLVRVRKTLPDNQALVVHIRQSACSGDCHKCSGCGAATEAVEFTAHNLIGAGVGDVVKVESASGPVLQAAAVPTMRWWFLFRCCCSLWATGLEPCPGASAPWAAESAFSWGSSAPWSTTDW